VSRLGRAAAELAAAGYHVHPLRARAKVPATRSGFKDATRDARQVARCWEAMPDANIGIACGASGIAVLDIDTKAGADPREILGRFDRGDAPVIGTGLAPERSERYPCSLAGRRGVQVYFRGDMPSAARLTIHGCEIKATGGYVVAPPSIHPSGVEYAGDLPPVGELPAVPLWLAELVQRPERRPFVTVPGRAPEPSRVLDGLARTVAQAQAGNRNSSLFWACCRAIERVDAGELDRHGALDALASAAHEAGLDVDEIRATIRSAFAQRSRAAA
jgi:hypothetical protein